MYIRVMYKQHRARRKINPVTVVLPLRITLKSTLKSRKYHFETPQIRYFYFTMTRAYVCVCVCVWPYFRVQWVHWYLHALLSRSELRLNGSLFYTYFNFLIRVCLNVNENNRRFSMYREIKLVKFNFIYELSRIL